MEKRRFQEVRTMIFHQPSFQPMHVIDEKLKMTTLNKVFVSEEYTL
jgi:hypothetical protein